MRGDWFWAGRFLLPSTTPSFPGLQATRIASRCGGISDPRQTFLAVLRAFLGQISQAWAKEMIDCLLDMKEAVEEAKRKKRANCGKKGDKLKRRYSKIIRGGFRANPLPDGNTTPREGERKRGRPKKTDTQNLLVRMRVHKKQILAFLDDFRVPFDNNLSERDLRMIKTQQNISGTFRSSEGGKDFCCIRSFISTIRKQAKNVFDSIHDVFAGNPSIPSLEES